MAISDRFLQELQSKIDIEQVISSHVNLRRRGKTYTGLCPFHNEKTPSFTVYPETQSFYCFGCGAAGDVISFVRRIENLDYVEAVKRVAQMAGMSMPEDGFDDTLSKKRNRILSANREAAKFYHSCLLLPKGKPALDYLTGRALSPQTIRHFGLGYSPNEWTALIDHMRELGFSPQELVEANLARRSDKNGKTSYYDNFRNRVMFPIIDLRGNVTAFGGRVMDDSKPKYINTSDTLVYKKSLGVFALNFAKNANERKLILVEGYMDVIALHQAGFTNAIACLGTAFTREQANLLSRYADEIYVCYDSDEAGTKATQKALSVLNTTGMKIRVIRMTGGKDADEIIRTHGRERFASLLSGAANRTEFELLSARENFDLSTDDGRVGFLERACEILSLRDSIECDIYATRIAGELGVSKDALNAKIKARRSFNRRREEDEHQKQLHRLAMSFDDKNNPQRVSNLRAARAEETLITSFIRNPDFYIKLKNKLPQSMFVTDFNRRIYASLCRIIDGGSVPEIVMFSPDFTPEEMDSVTRLSNLGSQIANTLEECEDCIRTLASSSETFVGNVSEMSDEEYLKLFKK